MRITVVPSDGRVNIDGEGYDKIDLAALDPSIHAIQWYDTDGEVEIKDARGRMIENREITSFDEFAFVIPLWEAAKAQDLADKAAAKAAQDAEILNQPPLPQ